MAQYKTIILYNKYYIPAQLIPVKQVFKNILTRTIEDVNHYLYEYLPKADIYSVDIGTYSSIKHLLYEHEIDDKRLVRPLSIKTNFLTKLRPLQEEVMTKWVESCGDYATLEARAGAGKTVMMSWVIHQMQQKTLILVPTNNILEQWKKSIYDFLGVAPTIIAGKLFEVGDITVASYKSLLKPEKVALIKKEYGMLIVDEAHMACAPKFRKLVASLPMKYKYGCTATRYRKDNTLFYLDGLLTKNTVVMETAETIKATVNVINTDHSFYFNIKDDYIKALQSVAENKLFCQEVVSHIKKSYIMGKTIIVLSPRIEQLETIEELLNNQGVAAGRLVAEINNTDKTNNDLLKQFVVSDRLVLLATDKLVGTGFDLAKLDCMYIPYSYNNKGNFIQFVGRIERYFDNKLKPVYNHYFFNDRGMSRGQQLSMLNIYKEFGYEVNFENDKPKKQTTSNAKSWGKF